MTEISIVIPTYNRPKYLEQALASCLAQQGVDGAFEIIIIVDNNLEGSARAQVEAISDKSSILIRYLHEPRPGISHARNTGVAASNVRYVVFLDDDEEADPNWLASHYATIRKYAADVVFGAVQASFPPSAAVDPYPRNKFSRDAGVPTGSMPPRLPGIGNTMLDRKRCFTDAEPFDPRMGLTGGEDTVFLRRLLRRGRKMVWCGEAIVRENVPADRLAPRFLLRRAFQRGQVTTFSCTVVDPPYRALAVRMMLTGCAQVLVFGPLALALRLVNHPRWLALMDRAALGLGKLLWHPSWQRRLYR